MTPLRVFILAGEPSGDKLGGALMAGLKALRPEVVFDGIGGVQMQAEGLVSRFDMNELSLMGLAEVLPKYLHLKRRIAQTAQAVIEMRPDVLITIDSPDFSLRVAKLVKAGSNIRTVHYVAPTVWAWRAGRAAKMARYIDHVLALFPFEPPLMQAAGMRCDFVGHPVVAEPVATQAQADAFRGAHAMGEKPLLMVLPGSRHGEVARLGERFAAVVRLIKAKNPQMHTVVPAAAPVAQAVLELTADWPDTTVLDPRQGDYGQAMIEKQSAFAAADIALAASGTVSLELAASMTPMVVAYDMSPLSRFIISRMMLVDTVTLVNLVSETRVVPEFIGKVCTPEAIAKGIEAVIAAPDAQRAAMALTMERLGRGGQAPGLRAAHAVLDGLGTV
ncbi:lipid-A-disaccharide synthase [Sulfitobacter guttiformis]|uniref:Lipid-A-disaccharide synthase n=1 Tax=Sulfitobacter guttiformis TaxID=74349 RepID=A0A420DI89_9RHOB|nr:lipid-A-disaccharide synthase [Sulfitobacter guttiformis]KIN72281.1 Lipid-A-disaccharide synthase [Sulfitobacter guttiformis KCTC 32187]RKE93953.1 lipid-A-disaccharide synthase [Sulfitobacter guttiformis]